MQEIEAKYRVNDLAPIRSFLEENDATFLESSLQRDTFFDRPGGEFCQRGCSVRLRISDPSGKAIITYKGPVEENVDVKIRQEVEISADPPASASEMLALLGFDKVFVIEKRRSSYRFGDCRIELDELPLLGLFVEIEGPSGDKVEEMKLKLEIRAEHVRQSYLHMLIEHCRINGLPPEAATFGK